MEKRIKYLLVALLCIMLISTLAAALITLWLSTTGKLRLILPLKVEADITEWDWGVFNITEEAVTLEHSQIVTFTNVGTTPLQLSATPDMDSLFPSWFVWWVLEWTGEGVILDAFEDVTTTFTLRVMAVPTRAYMETNERTEVDFGFDIIVNATEADVTYSLTIESMVGGTTSPIPGTYPHASGVSVKVLAIPDADYTFDYWILDAETRTENPTYVTMDADHTLTAYFEEVTIIEYILSITTTTGGTTDPVPDSYNYPEGSSAVVTAIPDVGFAFDCWNLDGANDTTNPISVLMDTDHALIAYFTEAESHDVNAMWIEPSFITLLIEEYGIGDTFTVTVWVNITSVLSTEQVVGAWQFYMIYDKSIMEVIDVKYTNESVGKSQFFEDINTWPGSPVYGTHNATHDYLMFGEMWDPMAPEPNPKKSIPAYGSLATVTFNITAVPPEGEIIVSIIDISTNYPSKTYVLDDDGEKVFLINVCDCIYTFNW